MKIIEKLEKDFVVFDGAFGTYFDDLTGNGEIPEVANITNPDSVKMVHRAYIEAGADVIRTNTFASNTKTLSCDSDIEDVYEIVNKNIRAALSIAREAVEESGKEVLIAGDIGPIDMEGCEEEYLFIARKLMENGADLLVFETFSDIEYILYAIHTIKNEYPDVFIIVQFCINQFGYTNTGLNGEHLLHEAINDSCIAAAGFNCGVGPGHMYSLMSKMDLPAEKYITALPNASYPKIIQDRMVFMKNETYFVDKIKDISRLGIDMIGGCCGTRPEYIKLVADFAHSQIKNARIGLDREDIHSDVTIIDNSFYKDKKMGEKKLMAVELSPPLDADYKKIMDAANSLKKLDVDVITFPDSPSGRTRADSVLMAAKIESQTGMCVMPHICCRDKNAIAIRSQLLGAQINDITNFLVITGDPVSTLMRQDVKSVFNFDSCGLMKLMRDMNEEQFATRPLTYGGAINYARLNLQMEINRVKKKMDMGASFFFTQPVFCKEDVEKIRTIKEQTGARILIGIMPLVSRRNAMFIKNEMVGIAVPDEVVAMYDGIDDKEQAENVGVNIAAEMMKLSKNFIDGYYYSIPFNRVYLLDRILEKLRSEND